jgi:GDPmannose 4,6-dehydratase
MGRIQRALILGAGGQDGRLLTQALIEHGADVVSAFSCGGVRGDLEGLPKKARLVDADDVYGLVHALRPDAIFYLAAYHPPVEGPAEPDIVVWKKSFAVHTDGLLHVLDACVAEAPHAHVVYASTSLVFGIPDSAPQNEQTPMRPRSPLAVSKAAAMNVCRACREKGVRASTAILYPHESPLRPRHHCAQRIAYAVAAARRAGERVARVELASPDAPVDWLAAEDVVDALRRIALQPHMDDYVVASGRARTAREIASVAAAHVGLDVEVVAHGRSPAPGPVPLIGDSTKLRTQTGWEPRVPFETWVARMVDAALVELARSAAS